MYLSKDEEMIIWCILLIVIAIVAGLVVPWYAYIFMHGLSFKVTVLICAIVYVIGGAAIYSQIEYDVHECDGHIQELVFNVLRFYIAVGLLDLMAICIIWYLTS